MLVEGLLSSNIFVAVGNCKEYKLHYNPQSQKWDITEATDDHLVMSLMEQAKIC